MSARIQLITSAANPLLRDVRRAVSRGDLTSDGLCIAEGFHLLDEALRSEIDVPVVIAAEFSRAEVETRLSGPRETRTVILSDILFQAICATESSQGVMALVRPRSWNLPQLFRGQSMVIVLDGLQDPGNAGAIVRSAEAFGATGVIFMKGTASPIHPKTLRASAGSLFRVPFVSGVDAAFVKEALKQHRVAPVAAMPFTGIERLAEDANFARPFALIVGSEGRGIGQALHKLAEHVAIPTVAVESLNAATAVSILLYEARRQRRS